MGWRYLYVIICENENMPRRSTGGGGGGWEQILAVLALPGVATFAVVAFVLIDGWFVAFREIQAGNVEVLGDFVLLGVFGIFVVALSATVSGAIRGAGSGR